VVPEEFAMAVEVNEALAGLTPRQQQVAHALAQGFNQIEIADALGVSRRTVANELTRIRAAFREVRASH
jgi:RNA polymerase sigma factor (sigma-70 family)